MAQELAMDPYIWVASVIRKYEEGEITKEQAREWLRRQIDKRMEILRDSTFELGADDLRDEYRQEIEDAGEFLARLR